MNNPRFKIIELKEHHSTVLNLLQQLNPTTDVQRIESLLAQMVALPNYILFGLFEGDALLGIAGGWTTVRIYCGKQLEVDNVVIDSNVQSKGYGKYFFDQIKQWSIANDYETIELNTYVANGGSHKFYFNQGFKILGFHFQHKLGATKIDIGRQKKHC